MKLSFDWLSHQQKGSLLHQDPETAPQRRFGIVTDCTKTQIDVRMGNVLECAFIVLWLQLGWVSSKQKVMQSPEALNVQEGDSVVLNCSYTGSTFYSLQWFRQDPGKGLTVLLLIQSAQREETSGRIKASLDKPSKHSTLYIAASQPSDSATYLCAIEAQCTTGSWHQYPNSAAGAPPTCPILKLRNLSPSRGFLN
uniref:Ig-like domain-containing protein n=1 Tax=Felis catus TaxID=9685 RepID=A0ABI7YT20_FELCA